MIDVIDPISVEGSELVFETDKFSTFAIVYKDELKKEKAPDQFQTGDHSAIVELTTVSMISAAGMIALCMIKRRKESI